MRILSNLLIKSLNDITYPVCPCGDAGQCPQQQPQSATPQDLLHLRHYFCILSWLDRKFTELEVRRAFTSFQLMTILQETHHSFLIVEHDPMLYEDAQKGLGRDSEDYQAWPRHDQVHCKGNSLIQRGPSWRSYSNLHITSRAQIFCEHEQAFAGDWRN
jgi:hypothetical protein